MEQLNILTHLVKGEFMKKILILIALIPMSHGWLNE